MVVSKPRYLRYTIDLSHPAIRYVIAAAISINNRYAATFPSNGPCLVLSNETANLNHFFLWNVANVVAVWNQSRVMVESERSWRKEEKEKM